MDSSFAVFLTNYGIYLLGINLGLSFIGAAMAKKRGYSYGGFLCLGIFVSFIVGIIVAACLKPKEDSEYLNPTIKVSVPYNQLNRQQQSVVQNTYANADNVFACKQCGAQCSTGMAFCPTCGKQNPASPPA